MTTFNRVICILASSMVLMCHNSNEAIAQGLPGKWRVQGKQQAFHFSEEGAFVQQFDDRDAAFGIWYMEDDLLGIIYMETEKLVGFSIVEMQAKKVVLQNMEDDNRVTLSYLGAHEIPDDYVSTVVSHFGDDVGVKAGVSKQQQKAAPDPVVAAADDSVSPPPAMAADTTGDSPPAAPGGAGTIREPAPFFLVDPGNLSLVGSWTADNDISDPMVFDEQGFFKKGRFDGDYIYQDLGLYHFDGSTLTIHFFKSAMNYSAGDIVSFAIRGLTPSRLTIDFGDGYAPVYSKTDRYLITSADRNEIRSEVNHKALVNTWWDTGRGQYLFLAPDLVISRHDGGSDFHTFVFEGNVLYFREIVASGGRQSFGEVAAWSDDAIVFATGKGQRMLRSGKGSAGLSTTESNYYRNYVVTTQNLKMQALLGIGQGMDIIEVEWKH